MRQRPRFFRWYRIIPLMSMALVTALSLGLLRAPSWALRRWLLPVNHQEAILESSERYGVDPLLVCAIIKCESNWEDDAVSDAGAIGLMQLMPTTSSELAEFGLVDAWSYDPQNLTDPATNIEYGCAYLGQLQSNLSSTDEVIAAYNAGPGSVEEWLTNGGDITEVVGFSETAIYMTSVKQAYQRYQELYTETLNER